MEAHCNIPLRAKGLNHSHSNNNDEEKRLYNATITNKMGILSEQIIDSE